MLFLPNLLPSSEKYCIFRFKLNFEINYRGRRRSFYSQEIFEEQKADETARSRKEKKER